jgi:hypothetical protein
MIASNTTKRAAQALVNFIRNYLLDGCDPVYCVFRERVEIREPAMETSATSGIWGIEKRLNDTKHRARRGARAPDWNRYGATTESPASRFPSV